MKKQFIIGLDFGTLSVRALLIDAKTGDVICDSVSEYKHGVLDDKLPSGTKLPELFALQVPSDYLESTHKVIRGVMEKSGADKDSVLSIGIDFTACTMLPYTENFTPLCELDKYRDEPHAYAKLWKHHAAQPEAEEITEKARACDGLLEAYGEKLSSEAMFPKILEIARHAPDVYRDAQGFMELGDWITTKLCGKESRSRCFSGFKALYTESGFPDNSLFKSIDPMLDGIIGTKLPDRADPITGAVGTLTEEVAEWLGLSTKTVVATPIIDAHASMPALGITGTDELMLILGTSACHIVNCKEKIRVPGISGYAKETVIPGLYTYEAGQASFGDNFDWFVKNLVSEDYRRAAKDAGLNIHAYLRKLAKELDVGESGLVSLDWFNGNRCTLSDSELSGMIVGLTLTTRPEQIYRSLIEATVFGTKKIIDNFTECGVPISRIVAAGGIAERDDMLMQILADVTEREIRVPKIPYSSAYGSAMYATVAAGCFVSLDDCARVFKPSSFISYVPNPESSRKYKELYSIYSELYELYGKKNDAMKRLFKLKKS